jgi:hypothetical protein
MLRSAKEGCAVRIDMKRFARCVGVFVAALLFIGAACPALAAKLMTDSPTDALSQASEIAEELSENAPSMDAAAFKKTMSDINVLDVRLAKALSPDRKKALDVLVTGIGASLDELLSQPNANGGLGLEKIVRAWHSSSSFSAWSPTGRTG